MINNINTYKEISSSNYADVKTTKKDSDKFNTSSENIKTDDLSSQALKTDTFDKSTQESVQNLTYKPAKKKLTAEEVNALKEEQNNSKADLIKKFISDTINNQAKILGKSTANETSSLSKESTDLLTKIFGSLEKAYPPIATTPEGAQAAISEGGAYSVNSVADRIMTMATSIAGDDPNKLQQMRDAVEKGFSQAGLEFNNATKSNLPQICKDTYKEIMNRFDKLQNKNNSEEIKDN